MGAWGLGLFQSDQDLDLASDLTGEAGLYDLEEKHQEEAQAKKPKETKKAKTKKDDLDDEIHYSIFADQCSHPELVRKHLDSGVLAQLIAKKQTEMQSLGPDDFRYPDPGYEFVFIGACAMTLGCTLPPPYKETIKKTFKSVGLMRDAVKQTDKALNGPDGYKEGEPYDFGSLGLIDTMNMGGPPEEDRMYTGGGIRLLNCQAPGGLPPLPDASIQKLRKQFAESKHGNDACGECGAKVGKNGTSLLSCGKCKKRKYCGQECQKKHWKLHKEVCEAPVSEKKP